MPLCDISQNLQHPQCGNVSPEMQWPGCWYRCQEMDCVRDDASLPFAVGLTQLSDFGDWPLYVRSSFCSSGLHIWELRLHQRWSRIVGFYPCRLRCLFSSDEFQDCRYIAGTVPDAIVSFRIEVYRTVMCCQVKSLTSTNQPLCWEAGTKVWRGV